MKNTHEKFMREALALAVRGEGHVSPNPMVGAVVVRKGLIVGRGLHKRAGAPHGEINAIKSVKGSLKGATLYVTLEPCCHYGKTPPCTDFIIESGIKKVVFGMKDVNPEVSGKGARVLKKNGITVIGGVLRAECRDLNIAFVKVHTRGLPYVTLKLAMTLDGKIATSNGQSKWITGEASRRMVHELRSKADGIMAGAGTVIHDNPQLNVRGISGSLSPVPIIMDLKLETSLSSKVFKKGRGAILYTSKNSSKAKGRRFLSHGVDLVTLPETKGGFSLKSALKDIAGKGINSILVEGGAHLAGSLLKEGLVDEVKLFVAPKLIGGDGVSAVTGLDIKNINKALSIKDKSITEIGDDILIEGKIR